jgi:hypothetical protein
MKSNPRFTWIYAIVGILSLLLTLGGLILHVRREQDRQLEELRRERRELMEGVRRLRQIERDMKKKAVNEKPR